MDKVKTLFVGTSEFAVPILKKLAEPDFIELVGVITQPDKPVGRKQTLTAPAVKLSIINYQFSIKLFQPESLKVEAESILNETQPELIIVASYGQFIPKVMLDYPKYNCLNIHGSLLPDLRGAVPIQMAILKGYQETGVSIQIMSEKMDEGDILNSEKCIIGNEDTYGTLTTKLSNISAGLLENTLPKWLAGEIVPQKQDESKATYCYIKDVSKAKAEVDWQKSAQEIERMVRAFNPAPIAWCKFPVYANASTGKQISKKLQIYSSRIAGDQNFDSEVGKLIRKGKQLFIKCGDGKYLELLELKLEGKERRRAGEYLFLAGE